MWERFSFYGMQAILAYYLYSTSGGLGMDQAQATALVGADIARRAQLGV